MKPHEIMSKQMDMVLDGLEKAMKTSKEKTYAVCYRGEKYETDDYMDALGQLESYARIEHELRMSEDHDCKIGDGTGHCDNPIHKER